MEQISSHESVFLTLHRINLHAVLLAVRLSTSVDIRFIRIDCACCTCAKSSDDHWPILVVLIKQSNVSHMGRTNVEMIRPISGNHFKKERHRTRSTHARVSYFGARSVENVTSLVSGRYVYSCNRKLRIILL